MALRPYKMGYLMHQQYTCLFARSAQAHILLFLLLSHIKNYSLLYLLKKKSQALFKIVDLFYKINLSVPYIGIVWFSAVFLAFFLLSQIA